MATKDLSQSPAVKKHLVDTPAVIAPLDSGFVPIVLGRRKYIKAVQDSGSKAVLHFALERPGGLFGRYSIPVFPDGHEDVEASMHITGIMIRTFMWQRGGFRLVVCGPPKQCEDLQTAFAPGGRYEFDAKQMPPICGRSEPFEVAIVAKPEDVPEEKNEPAVCGRDAKGSRLAFDLGKSDVKVVAVKDGEIVWSKETEWDITNADPDYHYGVIVKAMKEAATKLDKVEAVGGSSCGIVASDNTAPFCDLFPNVPPDVYKEKALTLFNRLIKNEFGDVPFKCINDGEVTAMAGQMMVKEGALFGISLGSNAGCGYVDEDGNLPGWINEMYATPLDLNPLAPKNPWTPYRGDTPMYLGQRAATKLAVKGGVEVPSEMQPDDPGMHTFNHSIHADCLKLIQAAMKDPSKEPKTRQIYETIGVYLGYTIANYCEVYKPFGIKHVLILGRVTSGTGGQVMMDKAKEVLDTEFPDLAHIKFHTPDEHMKRVGQCVAAAALPSLADEPPTKKART